MAGFFLQTRDWAERFLEIVRLVLTRCLLPFANDKVEVWKSRVICPGWKEPRLPNSDYPLPSGLVLRG